MNSRREENCHYCEFWSFQDNSEPKYNKRMENKTTGEEANGLQPNGSAL